MIWLRYPLSDISFGEGGTFPIPAFWLMVTQLPSFLQIRSELLVLWFSLLMFVLLDTCFNQSVIMVVFTKSISCPTSHGRLRYLVALHRMCFLSFSLPYLLPITAIPLYKYNPTHVASAL